jgi:hypothetical protein
VIRYATSLRIGVGVAAIGCAPGCTGEIADVLRHDDAARAASSTASTGGDAGDGGEAAATTVTASGGGAAGGESTAATSSVGAASSAGAGAAGGSGGGFGGAWTATVAASAAASSSSSAASSGAGGGPCIPGPLDDDPTVPPTLSATGLYSDIASGTLAPDVEAYHTLYALWSDGAEKYRFVKLPACSQIDSTQMDHWYFPIGTKLWKEFRVGGVRVETRMIKRIGPDYGDYVFAAYQWDAAGTEATHVPNGVSDANGTQHDIPATWECTTCHGHSPERVLGFGAVQLSHDGPGPTIETLSAQARLTVPHAKFVVPGDPTTAAALGYLHANCGHCHNETTAAASFVNPFVLRLSVDDATPADTGVLQTAVGVPVEKFSHPGVTHRISPGNLDASCVHYRMSVRGSLDQMPPFGTEQVDAAGMAAVDAFILSL